MSAHGSFETVDGRPAVVFERSLAHPVEAVWRAVTETGELAHWFPSSVEVDLRAGGRMRFVHADGGAPPAAGEVLELEPPRRFAFSWGEERLRFELEPAGEEGTRLRLTHFLSTRAQAARDAAGWHVCLDRLGDHLGGADAHAPTSEPTGEWRAHYDEYRRRGLPEGAPVPG